MCIEFIQILVQCIHKLLEFPAVMFKTITIAFILSAGCWVACSFYSRLWNKRYHITMIHHAMCFLAAMFTFSGVIIYKSLDYTRPITEATIQIWQIGLTKDRQWSNDAFNNAYDKVKAKGLEDFTNYQPPSQGGTSIPSNYNETIQQISEIYANEAINNFRTQHSFLSMILNADYRTVQQSVYTDCAAYFSGNSGRAYPVQRAIDLAASLISEEISSQVPRIVVISHITIIITFLMIQGVVFLSIGWSAFRRI